MQRTLLDAAIRWLDRLSPPVDDGQIEERRRARVIVAAAFFGAFMLLSTALNSIWLDLDRDIVIMNVGWGVAIVGLIFAARRLGSVNFLANSLIALVFIHTVGLLGMSAGRNVGALFALSVYPLFAVLVSGWRAGIAFTGVSIVAVLLAPHTPIDWLAPDVLEAAPVPAELIRDAFNVIFAIGFASSAYDVVRTSTIKDARNARASAELSGEAALAAADRQRKLIDISNRLHDIEFESFDEEIQIAVEETARFAGADRSVLRLIQGSEFVGRFTFGEDDTTPVHDPGGIREGRQRFRWSASLVGQGAIGQVRRLDEFPADAEEERAYLESRGVLSWLCIPILARGNAVGYQTFETLHEENTWSEEECASLRLLTELLSSAVLRHQTERALRESEIKFAGAFRHHPDAMVIMDLETDEILECNDQWLIEMAVESKAEALGRTLRDFGFDFTDDAVAMLRKVLVEHGRTPALEIPVLGRNGDQRTYLVSATHIDVGGRSCALANVHDLTDRKLLEQQLLHSQKMEAVGRLAGGVAHDFNNMLTVISGYSANLISNLDGELRQDAEEIHQAARRSADLTRQLLAFSRRQTLQTEVIDTHSVVTGLQSMLRPLIGESITLRIELGDEPAHVRTDRGQLEQAIVNLVVNARDAMTDTGTLIIGTDVVEHGGDAGSAIQLTTLEAGRYVVVSVTDDGEGMTPDLAERVMEPFYTTKPEGQGTGLGLAMVHGVARQCGGTLILDSEPGRGTRAEIHLPLMDHEAEGQSETVAPRQARLDPAAMRVLLAEDEPTLRRLAARNLRAAGYDVVEAENGIDALQRAEDLGDAIDIVVSDVVMPRLSGVELARRLRQRRPTLPIVLMSGYPDAAGETGETATIPDDVTFVQKPFEAAQLLDAMRVALEGKSEADDQDC